jgi:predicted RNase H-like HicB family nuclease
MKTNNNNNSDLQRPFEKRILESAAKAILGYHIVLEEAGELGFMGNSIEMPTVYADGKTADECVKAVREALQVAAATMLEAGKKPPVAFSIEKRDVQINIRLNLEEKNMMLKAAKFLGFRGISDFIRNCALERVRTTL